MSENRVTMQQKKAVAERAKGCCEYCLSQVRFAIQPFSVEHIIPKSQGGKTTLDNLALSCQGCNNHKYNKAVARDIVSGNVVSLYHPRQEQWSEHFASYCKTGNHKSDQINRVAAAGGGAVAAGAVSFGTKVAIKVAVETAKNSIDPISKVLINVGIKQAPTVAGRVVV